MPLRCSGVVDRCKPRIEGRSLIDRLAEHFPTDSGLAMVIPQPKPGAKREVS